MIYILLLFLVAMDVLFFIMFDRNILSPSVIVTSVFIISTFIAILNLEIWKFHFSVSGCFVIITGILAFALGEFLIKASFSKKTSQLVIEKKSIDVSRNALVFIILLDIFIVCVYFKALKKLAWDNGYNGNVLFLNYVRNIKINEHLDVPRAIGWSLNFVTVNGFIFLYFFIYNKVIAEKKCFLYLLPFSFHFLLQVLSTGRTGFIRMIVFSFVCFAFLYLGNKNSLKKQIKLFNFAFLGLIIFFVVFILAGSLKSSNLMKHAFSSISFYAGMSIPSLDKWLENPTSALYFGEETLSSLYNIFYKLGFPIPIEHTYYKHLEFINFNGTIGNVYTVFRRLIHDYGYLGMYLIMCFYGMFFSFWLGSLQAKNGFGIMACAYCFYAVAMVSIDEQFATTFFSNTFIVTIFFMWIFYKLLVNNGFSRNFGFIFKYNCKNKKLTGGGNRSRVVLQHTYPFTNYAVPSLWGVAA